MCIRVSQEDLVAALFADFAYYFRRVTLINMDLERYEGHPDENVLKL